MLEIIYITDYWYTFINPYCEEKCNRDTHIYLYICMFKPICVYV